MVNKSSNILFVISMLDTMSGPVKSLYLLAITFAKQKHNITVVYYSGEQK